MTQTPPVVGISGAGSDSASVRSMVAQIRAAGATPLFIGNHANRDADKDLGKIDALVVLGNNADIDPQRYGQKAGALTKPESATAEGKARGDYEYKLIANAIKTKMPVLGVCGGMQRINVMFGGSLHQHVPDLIGNDEHMQQNYGIAPFIPVQPVIIDNATMLGNISDGTTTLYTPAHGVGVGVVMENSMHHQAVNKVGDGLRASAYAADKLPNGSLLIEAIEADPNGPCKDQFIMGVQWHPEFGASALAPKITQRLTQEAAKYAAQGQRLHPAGEAQDESIFSALPQVKAPQPAESMIQMILRRREQEAANLNLSR